MLMPIANHIATRLLYTEVAERARANPKAPGHQAMEHVLNSKSEMSEIEATVKNKLVNIHSGAWAQEVSCLLFFSLLFFLGYCQEQGRKRSRVSLPVRLRACVGRVQGACTCWCPCLFHKRTHPHAHTHTHKHTHSLTNAFHQGLFNALPCACSARTYVHAHGHVCVFTHTHSLTNKHMHAHKHYTRLDAYVARTVYRKTPGKAAQAFANFFFYFFNTFLPRYIARRRQSYTSFCLRSPHRLHTLQQLMRSTISSTRYVLCV
jgi:hypothetical protein